MDLSAWTGQWFGGIIGFGRATGDNRTVRRQSLAILVIAAVVLALAGAYFVWIEWGFG